jgi:hypothetical protein
MSAKLYLIQNEDGKYYNAAKNYYTELYISATYATTMQKATDIINAFGLKNHSVTIVTEEEFTTSLASKTVKLIIQMDFIRRELDELRWNVPTISGLNKTLCNFLKNTSNQLMRISKPMFDEFVRKKEDTTDDVRGNYEEFINEISKIEMYDCSELTLILKAFKKDRKSMLGIAKKTMRNEK